VGGRPAALGFGLIPPDAGCGVKTINGLNVMVDPISVREPNAVPHTSEAHRSGQASRLYEHAWGWPERHPLANWRTS
jgi:hypothetical protein